MSVFVVGPVAGAASVSPCVVVVVSSSSSSSSGIRCSEFFVFFHQSAKLLSPFIFIPLMLALMISVWSLPPMSVFRVPLPRACSCCFNVPPMYELRVPHQRLVAIAHDDLRSSLSPAAAFDVLQDLVRLVCVVSDAARHVQPEDLDVGDRPCTPPADLQQRLCCP